MARRYAHNPIEDTINPFEMQIDKDALMKNLDCIDRHQLVVKFKRTQDPINLAFETIDNVSLKYLAKDFIRESFSDMISFISKICK